MKTMTAVPGAARAVTGGVSCCSQPAISHPLAALRRAGLIERADDERSCEGDAERARRVYFRPVLQALEAVGKALTPPRQAE